MNGFMHRIAGSAIMNKILYGISQRVAGKIIKADKTLDSETTAEELQQTLFDFIDSDKYNDARVDSKEMTRPPIKKEELIKFISDRITKLLENEGMMTGEMRGVERNDKNFAKISFSRIFNTPSKLEVLKNVLKKIRNDLMAQKCIDSNENNHYNAVINFLYETNNDAEHNEETEVENAKKYLFTYDSFNQNINNAFTGSGTFSGKTYDFWQQLAQEFKIQTSPFYKTIMGSMDEVINRLQKTGIKSISQIKETSNRKNLYSEVLNQTWPIEKKDRPTEKAFQPMEILQDSLEEFISNNNKQGIWNDEKEPFNIKVVKKSATNHIDSNGNMNCQIVVKGESNLAKNISSEDLKMFYKGIENNAGLVNKLNGLFLKFKNQLNAIPDSLKLKTSLENKILSIESFKDFAFITPKNKEIKFNSNILMAKLLNPYHERLINYVNNYNSFQKQISSQNPYVEQQLIAINAYFTELNELLDDISKNASADKIKKLNEKINGTIDCGNGIKINVKEAMGAALLQESEYSVWLETLIPGAETKSAEQSAKTENTEQNRISNEQAVKNNVQTNIKKIFENTNKKSNFEPNIVEKLLTNQLLENDPTTQEQRNKAIFNLSDPCVKSIQKGKDIKSTIDANAKDREQIKNSFGFDANNPEKNVNPKEFALRVKGLLASGKELTQELNSIYSTYNEDFKKAFTIELHFEVKNIQNGTYQIEEKIVSVKTKKLSEKNEKDLAIKEDTNSTSDYLNNGSKEDLDKYIEDAETELDNIISECLDNLRGNAAN